MNFIDTLSSYNIKWASGVPCSIMKSELEQIDISGLVTWIPAVDEATGLGIVNGLTVAGECAILMMQNSAIGAVSDKLMSFNHPYNVDTFLYITMRGYPGDALVHRIPYGITEDLLRMLGFYVFDSRRFSLDRTLSFENLTRKAYLRYKDE